MSDHPHKNDNQDSNILRELSLCMKSIANTIESATQSQYIPQVSQFISSITSNITDSTPPPPIEEKSQISNQTTEPSIQSAIYIHKCQSNTPKDYKGICISVGGVRGMIQLGSIHEFWVRGQLKNLSYYSGSSIGSMICSLLCVGYSPLELLTAFCAPDISNQFRELNFVNLTTIFGFYPNSILKKKIEQMFMLKIGYLPTFSDLYTKLNKTLIIPIYCVSESSIEDRKIYCSHMTTPDMQISDAVILSCSIPIVFQKAVYKNKVYIDGAYTSTFPIKQLQEIIPQEYHILGICMKEDTQRDLNSFIGYSTSIFMIPLDQQHNLVNLSPNSDIIQLQVSKDASPIDFNINVIQKMKMFSMGTKQIKDLLGPVIVTQTSLSSLNNSNIEQLNQKYKDKLE